ncbi:MAG: cryptochrome/photolyase family protein [Sediminibacterium sp.]
MAAPINIFWFRRDLRWDDNAGLYHALYKSKFQLLQVLPIFIFDKTILSQSENKEDRRVDFIHQNLTRLQTDLVAKGKSLWVQFGTPTEVFEKLFSEFQINAVYTNHDYGPKANARDTAVEKIALKNNATYHHFKDQVIFEKEEVIKDDGSPYTIYTPYANKWRTVWAANTPKKFPSEKLLDYFLNTKAFQIPTLKDIGFEKTDLVIPPMQFDKNLVKKYTEQRNFPALNATTNLSVHLRFGTISARTLALETQSLNATFFNEMIWRDFYHMILWHFPQIADGKSFKPKYDFIEWRNNEKEFEAWCEGRTGYPIVDAGMRELNTTGFMHNRVRMIVASFLTKHLLIDWRWGEAYFAQKLLDFDLAANNGGWQWASGSGCDAAPYFRVFNPRLQTEKFDKELKYIRRWIPELDSLDYPKPIVVHEEARERVLAAYAKALKDK